MCQAVDQMTVGHLWLLDTLGPAAVPTIGWQIDPFGNMASTPRLFAQMGFKYQCVGVRGIVTGRVGVCVGMCLVLLQGA
jgi:hypothetical protein